MDIKEMLINKKVIEDAKVLQEELIKTLDAFLLSMHYCIIGKQPNFTHGLADEEKLEKDYIELSNLRKSLSISTEDFINKNINGIIHQIPDGLPNFKEEIKRLLKGKDDK